jgi:hypothetical protein
MRPGIADGGCGCCRGAALVRAPQGQIDAAEFRRALLSFGIDESMRPQIDALFDTFDKDGSGSIEYRELNRLLRKDAQIDPSMQPTGAVTLKAKNAVGARQNVDLVAGRRRTGLAADVFEGVSLDRMETPASRRGRGAPVDAAEWSATQNAMVVAILKRELGSKWLRASDLFRSCMQRAADAHVPHAMRAVLRRRTHATL